MKTIRTLLLRIAPIWFASLAFQGNGTAQVSPCGSGQQLSDNSPIVSGNPVYWSSSYISSNNLSVNMNGNTVTGSATMVLQAGTAICLGPGFKVAGTGTGVTFTALIGSTAPSGAYAITTNSLPNGTVGTYYSAALSATGGISPYTWSQISGSLPSGLTMGATGEITGTPSAAGTYQFTLLATDAALATATATLSITIAFATQAWPTSLL